MPTSRRNDYTSMQDVLNQFAEQYRRDYATYQQQAAQRIQVLGPTPDPNTLQRPQPVTPPSPVMEMTTAPVPAQYAPPCDHTWEMVTRPHNPTGPYQTWVERCIHCNLRRQQAQRPIGRTTTTNNTITLGNHTFTTDGISTGGPTPGRGGRASSVWFHETMHAASREEYERMMTKYREREQERRAKRDTERQQEKARQDRLNALMQQARAPREYRMAPLEKKQEIEANVRRLWRHEVRSGLIDGAPAKEVQEPHRHEWIEAGTDQRNVFVRCAACNASHWIPRASWGRLLRTAAREHEPVSLREFGWDDEADNGPEAVYPETARAINF